MANIETVTLDGTELKVEGLGGQNTEICNKSDNAIYASAYANIVPEGDNVIEIAAGNHDGLYGTNGTIYLLGTGKVELRGTDYSVNFRKPSSSAGGGGDKPTVETMPFMDGIFSYFVPENILIEDRVWKNALPYQASIQLVGDLSKMSLDDGLHLNSGAYGQIQSEQPNVIYAICKLTSNADKIASALVSKGLHTNCQPVGKDFSLYGYDTDAATNYANEYVYSFGVYGDTTNVIKKVSSLKYTVCCMIRTGTVAKLYCNGELIMTHQVASDFSASYNSYMYINTEVRDTSINKFNSDGVYKFLAFGRSFDENAVIQNSQWLMQKYGIGGD